MIFWLQQHALNNRISRIARLNSAGPYDFTFIRYSDTIGMIQTEAHTKRILLTKI